MKRAAFSPDMLYRYTLWREWIGGEGLVMFIGLNPSTATDTLDDPTIRRCIGFAKRWGYSAYLMTNLFAYRATDPNDMKEVEDPVGLENNTCLIGMSKQASLVVAAWGVHGTFQNRAGYVSNMLGPMKCLGTTKEGHPRHPLYVKGDTQLIDFNPPKEKP